MSQSLYLSLSVYLGLEPVPIPEPLPNPPDMTLSPYLSEQCLHEQDSDTPGQLLAHEGEGKLLQGAAHQGHRSHHGKHEAPGLDGGLLVLKVWVVEHADDVGEGQGESRHHDAQPG